MSVVVKGRVDVAVETSHSTDAERWNRECLRLIEKIEKTVFRVLSGDGSCARSDTLSRDSSPDDRVETASSDELLERLAGIASSVEILPELMKKCPPHPTGGLPPLHP